MSDTYAGSCKDCRHCIGNVMDLNTSKCTVVFNPVTGAELPAAYARMDRWQGYALPCGYRGALWSAKDAQES